jgi:uncharacterized membrane protein
MQDLTLYYLFLKCNLMHYYFDKILLFAKSGCYTTFTRGSQNMAAMAALLDTLSVPSTDGVDKVY